MKYFKTDLHKFAQEYIEKIDQERKVLIELYPDLEKKRKKMTLQARQNISKARKAYYANLRKNGGKK